MALLFMGFLPTASTPGDADEAAMSVQERHLGG
jgi:hypothetical protein